MSFSTVPSDATAPPSNPPWPASIIIIGLLSFCAVTGNKTENSIPNEIENVKKEINEGNVKDVIEKNILEIAEEKVGSHAVPEEIIGWYISDDEKIDVAAKRIMNRFKPAFEELAK